MRSALFYNRLKTRSGFELGKGNSQADFLEDYFDFHADSNFFDGASYNVTTEPRAFVQIDPGGDVGNIFFKSSQSTTGHLADHGECKNVAPATQRSPVEMITAALDAGRTRAPDPGLAVAAALHNQLPFGSGIPERLGDGCDLGKGLFYFSQRLRHVKPLFQGYQRLCSRSFCRS